MNSKLCGGILLVVGTTIGAGMLALPIATAELGFWGSIALLVASWALMSTCAFIFLEVNLWLPPNSNLISMAGATLGRGGQAITWACYLFLLYSIISAYIAGGGDLFHYLLGTSGIHVPVWLADIIFTAIMGAIVYLGIKSVDYVNRGLMFGKLGALILLVLLILPFVTSQYWVHEEIQYFPHATSLTVTMVAFGCLMIVPSLRTYFGEDVASLRKAIFIGMLIPLFCYIAWDMVIMGVIPFNGSPGLNQMLQSAKSSDIVAALTTQLHKTTITSLAKFFTSICMATSFLSISLCLSDFLADGLRVKKQGLGSMLVFGATFLPPMLIVLFYPDAFLRGLNYAGIGCLILMVLLPPLMAWRGRYAYAMSGTYQVAGGKFLLAMMVLFAVLILGVSFKGIF